VRKLAGILTDLLLA